MKRKKSSARDLISNLPCDIIENILQRLILRDAVRTSILSRSWRYRWATLPALLLRFSSQLKLSSDQDLNTVVNQILILYQGPIKELEVLGMNLKSFRYLQRWFHRLSKHHLQTLYLHWALNHKDFGRLPSSFFSFSQLRHLCLSKCVLKLPSSFKGFSHLVSFKIENVKIKTHKLSSLISKSPFLEHVLIVNRCYNFKDLGISASKLKKFHFDGTASSINFVNVPLLEEVHIVLFSSSGPDKVKQDNFMKSLIQFSSIRKLVLNSFLKWVALSDGVWRNHIFHMNTLKVLRLDISTYEVAEVSCALCLIKSAPNLETLDLIISAPVQLNMSTCLFLEEQQEQGISLIGLKEVMVYWLYVEKPDMELVQLIFSFSPALEKFIIHPNFEEFIILPDYGGCYLVEELDRMPKASPKVDIVIGDGVDARAFGFP